MSTAYFVIDNNNNSKQHSGVNNRPHIDTDNRPHIDTDNRPHTDTDNRPHTDTDNRPHTARVQLQAVRVDTGVDEREVISLPAAGSIELLSNLRGPAGAPGPIGPPGPPVGFHYV